MTTPPEGAGIDVAQTTDDGRLRVDPRAAYAVWEITLACNLACAHCGSRAGDARANELTTAEAFDLVAQMAEIGITEVTLIGGEAFLRRDWLDIAAEIVRHGMQCTMTTGGYGLSAQVAARMAEVGINSVSVSIDGLAPTHNELRGRPRAFEQALTTLGNLREAGILVSVNTQINRRSAPELPLLYEQLDPTGFFAWQLQMTVPMGNAAEQAELLFQPVELLDLYPVLGALAARAIADGRRVQGGNNIGYYGPYERLYRGVIGGLATEAHTWNGCTAGVSTLGIEADGAIKGCPSLPTAPYTGGNIRERSLREIVYATEPLTFNDDRGTDHLWGFCQGCRYAALCRGGCSWTSHVFFDRRGNNPYCHHRALTQAARGVRERVEPEVPAAGLPFDNGRFALLEEPLSAPWPEGDPLRFSLERVQWPAAWLEAEPGLVERLRGERERAIAAYTS